MATNEPIFLSFFSKRQYKKKIWWNWFHEKKYNQIHKPETDIKFLGGYLERWSGCRCSGYLVILITNTFQNKGSVFCLLIVLVFQPKNRYPKKIGPKGTVLFWVAIYLLRLSIWYTCARIMRYTKATFLIPEFSVT